MFESITKNLTDSLGNMMRGKLTESNIREGMAKVRQALLEADVNYDVARDFASASPTELTAGLSLVPVETKPEALAA